MSPWSAIAFRASLEGSGLWKSAATKRRTVPFRRSTVTISWGATSSLTKPGRRAKVEAGAREADAGAAASAVVAAVAEVEEAAVEAEGVEAGIAAIAVAVGVEIAAGKRRLKIL
jgi:hypothetical protein